MYNPDSSWLVSGGGLTLSMPPSLRTKDDIDLTFTQSDLKVLGKNGLLYLLRLKLYLLTSVVCLFSFRFCTFFLELS